MLASKRLEELNKRLPLIKGKNQKKRYTKIVEVHRKGIFRGTQKIDPIRGTDIN